MAWTRWEEDLYLEVEIVTPDRSEWMQITEGMPPVHGVIESEQETMSQISPRIIDRGRGPELEGTRVTIYRIMDFVRDGSSPEEVARELELSGEQVSLALDYITAHRDEVEAAYEQILRRVSGPNPDSVEARLAKTPDELKRRLEQRRQVITGHADPR